MSSSDKPVLYSYWRSSSSWRVRIALELKGIAYEYRGVNLLKNEQTSEEYKAINAQGEIPSLEIDGHTLSQSLAIIEYLEETRPETVRLLPADAVQRAQARQIAQIVACDTQPFQNLRTIGMIGSKFGEEHKAPWAKHFITISLVAIEKVLSKTAGRFCVGDTVSIADLCLIPQLYGARRFGVELTEAEFPHILRVEHNCMELPAFQAADCNVQPDAPKA